MLGPGQMGGGLEQRLQERFSIEDAALLSLFEQRGEHAGPDLPFELAADPNRGNGRFELEQQRKGGDPPVAFHEHEALGLCRRQQFLQVVAVCQCRFRIVVEARAGGRQGRGQRLGGGRKLLQPPRQPGHHTGGCLPAQRPEPGHDGFRLPLRGGERGIEPAQFLFKLR